MSQSRLKRDNHYVPHSYLKRWFDNDGKVWSYRVLVPHPNVHLWKSHSAKGIAYHKDLYTRVIASGESDDIERWFDEQFESPAGMSIQKAVSDEKLTAGDWKILIRFLAAQDVRTPARLIERLKHFQEIMPALVDKTLATAVPKLEAAKRMGVSLPKADSRYVELFPGRVTVKPLPEQDGGQLRFETIVGRSLWLFSLKHLLTETINVLLQHKWTILRSPPGMEWLTSDDPVIRLNFHDAKRYDFGGGWGSKGTEIVMPLSPTHLMYTQIGQKPPPRGHVVSLEMATAMKRFIVEHAHRFVFSRSEHPEVAAWRPRTVDRVAFVAESEQWRRWHAEQSNAERALFDQSM